MYWLFKAVGELKKFKANTESTFNLTTTKTEICTSLETAKGMIYKFVILNQGTWNWGNSKLLFNVFSSKVLNQRFSTAGTRLGTGTWREYYQDLVNSKFFKYHKKDSKK